MTQKQRILYRLRRGVMCGMEPLDWSPRITRVAARVNDLRLDGHLIATEHCKAHQGTAHHAAYRLA